MIKRAVSAVLGLFGICLPLAAQLTVYEPISLEELRGTGAVDVGPALTLHRPDLFSSVDSVLLLRSLPVTTYLDGRRFPISGQHSAFDFFPVAFLTAVDVQPVNSSVAYSTDAPGGVLNLRLNRNYSGGEFGVFYGKSDGKYGSELFQTYIIGGVGNDKFQITAGAMFEESSGSRSEMRLQR